MHQLASLNVLAWIGRKFKDTETGLATNNLSMTIELKSGEKYAVDFGGPVSQAKLQTVFAVVTLEGERWAFIFPPGPCANVAQYLTIPADAP